MDHPKIARKRRAWTLLVGALLLLPLAAWTGPGLAQVPVPAPATPEPDHQQAEERDDAAIERQLASIYGAVEGLQGIEARVRGGLVILSGEVASAELQQRAAKLASSVAGVVDVQNDIILSTDIGARVAPVVTHTLEQLRQFAWQLPLLLIGVLVLALAWLFAGWLTRQQWLLGRLRHRPFIRDIAVHLLKTLVIVVAALFVLDLLGLTTLVGAVLGAAGVASLVVGFAFRDLIENYIASILLSVRQPFRPDDLIRVGEYEGRVSRLTSRATILITLDGNHVRLPNSTIYKSPMINYTRNPSRRLTFRVGIDTGFDLQPVQALAEASLGAIDGVAERPPPMCLVEELGDSAVVLLIQAWVDQRSHDFLRVRSESIRQVKQAFDDAGIVMPEPIFNIKEMAPTPPPGEGAAIPKVDQRPLVSAATTADNALDEPLSNEARDGENLLDPDARGE